MTRKPFYLCGLIAILLYCSVFSVAPAHAQTTLADLLNGGTLTVFDKVFLNFRLYTVDIVNADLPITANIHAIPWMTTHLVYDVATLSGAKLIKDNTLSLGAAGIVDPGEVRINEVVSGPNGVLLGRKEVFLRFGDFKQDDHIDFAPQNFITVETIITLDSHTTGAAGLGSFEQRFSQLDVTVPEPGAWALLGAGLVGMGLLRWRRRK